METKKMISEGLSINKLEERLEMDGSFFNCCSEGVSAVCCSINVGPNTGTKK